MAFWKKTTPGGGKSKHKGLGTHGGSGEGPATAGMLPDSGDRETLERMNKATKLKLSFKHNYFETKQSLSHLNATASQFG